MQHYFTKEDLADGEILMELKLTFLEDLKEDHLIDVLQCLRDSTVLVPMNPGMQPALVETPDGTRYLPMFSRYDQVPENYGRTVTLHEMEAVKCVGMAHSLTNVAGLVLDGFTKQVNLAFDVADIIPKMDSLVSAPNVDLPKFSGENITIQKTKK